VLLDIGGYFAEVVEVAAVNEGHVMPLGIVEDTENGHQRYEIVRGLSLPVLSVARSPLKNNEDFLIGQSVLFSADAILRDMGELIQYMRVGILGFGKIGRSILQHLLQRNVSPMVYDINSVRRLEAYTGGAAIPEPAEILREANVLFCATGSRSLNIFRFRDLRPGCFVFSVTSSDDEMDLSYLESEYKTEKITPHVTKYYNFYNHFFLVNRGNAVNFIHKAVVGDFIHLVKAEMLCCLGLLSAGKLEPGLQEATSAIRATVASEWINNCVLRSYGATDA
jgi:adenosylhomocysteinase